MNHRAYSLLKALLGAILTCSIPLLAASTGTATETTTGTASTAVGLSPLGSIIHPTTPLGEIGIKHREILKTFEDQATSKARPGSEPTAQMIREYIDSLEDFLAANPDSPYSPDLRFKLGELYFEHGRYSQSLDHWRTVWESTRHFQDGFGRKVGERAFARLGRLLASLGRIGELEALLSQVGDRTMVDGYAASEWSITKEALGMMKVRPDLAYRCGSLALNSVADVLTGSSYAEFLDAPSPETGFSLLHLEEMARKVGVPLRAALRESGSDLVVPSVVHWKENHYAAITELYDDAVRVVDPTFGSAKVLGIADVSGEASGVFLIPAGELPRGWRWLDPAESALVFGRGYPFLFADGTDGTCCDCPPGGGSCCGASTPSVGMPTWRISEPYINIWLHDTPLLYKPNRGPEVRFDLYFKQRGLQVPPNYSTSFGETWRSPWSSWVSAQGIFQYGVGTLTVHGPDGRSQVLDFALNATNSSIGYFNFDQAKLIKDGGGNVLGFDVHHADGSVDRYRQRSSTGSPSFYITSMEASNGTALTIDYYPIPNPSTDPITLEQVIDEDGNAYVLHYDNSNDPALATSLTSTVAGNVYLEYDNNGWLIRITDTVGIVSEFGYDVAGWVDELKTPYGTTTFSSASVTSVLGEYRQAIVGEANGAQHLYVWSNEDGLTSDPPDPDAPGYWDTGQSNRRNSYHWGPVQTGLLSTFDLTQMSQAELKSAHIKHWLGFEDAHGNTPVNTLSWEVEPSPDGGSTWGKSTWYDYPNKKIVNGSPLPSMQGTQIQPSSVARVQPDGSTWYQVITRNSIGKPLSLDEHWKDGLLGPSHSRSWEYFYDSSGVDLLSEVGPNGDVGFTNTYNSSHQLLTRVDPIGVTKYVYNADLQITAIQRPSGHNTTNTYDSGTGELVRTVEYDSATPVRTNLFKRLTGQTLIRARLNGGNSTNTTEWLIRTNAYGLVTTNVVDSLGRTVEILYPGTSNTKESWYYELWPGQTNSGSTSSRFLVDNTGYVDRLGNTNIFTWDSLRRKAFDQDPRNATTQYQYCDCGSVSSVTRGYNSATPETSSMLYDQAGRMTNYAFPGFGSVSYQYDSVNRLVKTTDALGSTTNYYDNLNRLTEVWNAFGRTELRVYDDEDRLISMTDRNGVTTTNTYDAAGRMTYRAVSGAGSESWGYTTNVAFATSYTNPISLVSYYKYHALGWRTNEVVSGVMTNRWFYNGAGKVVRLFDGNQVVATSAPATNGTVWIYDEYGRIKHKVYANNQTNLTYYYDAAGRLSNRWSQAKGNTAYGYDASGNVVSVNYSNATPDLTFTYDALNRVTNMVDAVGTTKYVYSDGLLHYEDGPWSGTNDLVIYSYHSSRRRSQLVVRQPTGNPLTNSYTWDGGGRLSTLASPAGTHTYQYNGQGNLVRKLLIPNSTFVTNTFDGAARLLDSRYMVDSTWAVLNQHGYVYNNAHERTTLSRTNSSNTGWNGYSTATYDGAGEVREVRAYNASGVSVPGENFFYGYDAGWNMLKRTNNLTINTYTPNVLNQAAGSYDSNGNRTSGADSYTYDVENQLIGIEEASSWKLEFVYDGRQRLRVIKDYEYSGGGYSLKGEVRLMYDGMNVIQERNGSGHPTVSYTRGLDLSGTLDGAGGIGGLLTRSSHATSSPFQQNSHAFYHADGNGNVTYLRRSDGASYAAYKYDPFGRTLLSAGGLASANRMRFSSKPWIQSSSGTDGMYYYGYRFYDPLTQRWLNRDPIEENGGVNLFSFVRNDPHNRSDLLGLAYGNPVSGPNGPVGPSSPWGSGGVFNGPDGNTGSVGGGVGAYGVFGGEFAVSFVQCCINNDKYMFTVFTACGGLGVSVGIGGSKPKIEMPGGVKDSPGGSFSAGGDCPQDRYYVKAAVTAGVFEFGMDFVDEGDSVESANGVSVPPSYGGRYVVCSDTVVSVKKTGCCPKPTTPKVR